MPWELTSVCGYQIIFSMAFDIKNRDDWVIIRIVDRVDAFNFDELTNLINSFVKKGQLKLAVDLKGAFFLSLPTIKFLASVASDLKLKGGAVALLAPTEKIKRQIDIFASLDTMQIFRSIGEWERELRPLESTPAIHS